MKLDDRKIISRILHAYGISKNIQLAEIFKVAPNTISSWKKRGIPGEYILKTSIDTGYAIPWLETGEGKKFASRKTNIEESKRNYRPGGDKITTQFITISQDIYHLLANAQVVLESNTAAAEKMKMAIEDCYVEYVKEKKGKTGGVKEKNIYETDN